MVTNLDHTEQEQLDQLKHLWNRFGNLVSTVICVAALAYLGWFGWNWWQGQQAAKAAAMFDEFARAETAGDAERTTRIFNDLKDRYGSTAFAGQAGLLAARVQFDKGQLDQAASSLAWVAENASEPPYKAMARLRLAGILLDQKKYDDALKQLSQIDAPDFLALADDRRGDVYMAQGKRTEAKDSYAKAWQAMDPTADYRRVIEAKLTALGAPPQALPGVTAQPAGGAK